MTIEEIRNNCREGWKVNERIAPAILKALERNAGQCPCNNDSEDKHCPCSNYRLHDKCCCNLYIRK